MVHAAKPLLNSGGRACFRLAVFGLAVSSTPAAKASCADPTTRYSSENLVAFVADPHILLDRYPRGSELMAIEVAAIASASAMALSPLLQAARSANKDQGVSIGEGLARASGLCRLKDAGLAAEIGKLASRSGNMDVIASFGAHTYYDAEAPTASKVFGASSESERTKDHPGKTLSFHLERTLPDPFAPMGPP